LPAPEEPVLVAGTDEEVLTQLCNIAARVKGNKAFPKQDLDFMLALTMDHLEKAWPFFVEKGLKRGSLAELGATILKSESKWFSYSMSRALTRKLKEVLSDCQDSHQLAS
jgi:hypothetical protein